MTRNGKLRWTLLVATNAAFWCVLSLQQSHGANNQLNRTDGSLAAQQRSEMIIELKEIKTAVNMLVQYRRSEALPSAVPLQK
jgi:hypothetical protein